MVHLLFYMDILFNGITLRDDDIETIMETREIKITMHELNIIPDSSFIS